MSQKSSVPQVVKSVSQVLTPDTKVTYVSITARFDGYKCRFASPRCLSEMGFHKETPAQAPLIGTLRMCKLVRVFYSLESSCNA